MCKGWGQASIEMLCVLMLVSTYGIMFGGWPKPFAKPDLPEASHLLTVVW